MESKSTVIITGSSSGIGLQAAKVLAQTGQWFVMMACRDLAKAQQAAQTVGIPQDSYAILQLAHTERLAKTGITIETENMVQIQEAEEGIALGVKAWKTYAFAGDNFAKGTERIIDI